MRKGLRLLAPALILLPVLAACANKEPSITPGGTATVSAPSTGQAEPTGSLPLTETVAPKWKIKLSQHMRSAPVAVEGVLYATMEDSCICAFDAETGDEIWRVDPPGVGLTTPAVWNGLVIFGLSGDLRMEPEMSQTAYLYALDAETGDARWRYKTEGAKDENSGLPLVLDGTVYFGSGWSDATSWGGTIGHITALDAMTGSMIWQRETTGSQAGRLAAADGTLFVSNGYDFDYGADTIYALDAKTGTEKWKLGSLPYDVGDIRAGDNGLIYVSGESKLAALEATSGKELWSVEQDGYTYSTPAIDGATFYVAQNQERSYCPHGCPPPPNDDYLLAVDSKSGAERWKVDIDLDSPHEVQYHNGVLYYTTFRPDGLKAVDAHTGKARWVFATEDSIADSVAFDGGVAYFGEFYGTLYALPLPGSMPPTPKPSTPSSTGGTPGSATATVFIQEGPMRGFRAPDFELVDMRTGNGVKLSALQGKPVFLNFWATWCPPCREEMPEIQKLYTQYKGQVEFIGVSSSEGDTEEKARAFVEEGRFEWTFVHDPNADVNADYFGQTIPTSYFIDRDGIISAVHIGQMNAEQIEDYIRAIK